MPVLRMLYNFWLEATKSDMQHGDGKWKDQEGLEMS